MGVSNFNPRLPNRTPSKNLGWYINCTIIKFASACAATYQPRLPAIIKITTTVTKTGCLSCYPPKPNHHLAGSKSSSRHDTLENSRFRLLLGCPCRFQRFGILAISCNMLPLVVEQTTTSSGATMGFCRRDFGSRTRQGWHVRSSTHGGPHGSPDFV